MQIEQTSAQQAHKPSIDTDAAAAEAKAVLKVLSKAPPSSRLVTAIILAHIVTRTMRRGGRAQLTCAMVARDTGLPFNTVRKALAAIRKLPGISCQSSHGSPMVWSLEDGACQ